MSIDFDYFSHHSRMGPKGMGVPMPVPIPGGGSGGGAGAGAEAAAGAGGGLGPDDDGFGPMEGETVADPGTGAIASEGQGEFAVFNEPDYGFQAPQQSQDDWDNADDGSGGWGDTGGSGDSWGSSCDCWGNAAGDDEGTSVGGILGKVSEMFGDD